MPWLSQTCQFFIFFIQDPLNTDLMVCSVLYDGKQYSAGCVITGINYFGSK